MSNEQMDTDTANIISAIKLFAENFFAIIVTNKLFGSPLEEYSIWGINLAVIGGIVLYHTIKILLEATLKFYGEKLNYFALLTNFGISVGCYYLLLRFLFPNLMVYWWIPFTILAPFILKIPFLTSDFELLNFFPQEAKIFIIKIMVYIAFPFIWPYIIFHALDKEENIKILHVSTSSAIGVYVMLFPLLLFVNTKLSNVPHTKAQPPSQSKTATQVSSSSSSPQAPPRKAQAPNTPIVKKKMGTIKHCPYVNVRKKPSPNATFVTRVNCGMEVEILDDAPSLSNQKYTWYQIQTKQGQEGWMYGGENDTWLKIEKYITQDGQSFSIKNLPDTPVDKFSDTYFTNFGIACRFHTNQNGLTMYVCEGKISPIITSLANQFHTNKEVVVSVVVGKHVVFSGLKNEKIIKWCNPEQKGLRIKPKSCEYQMSEQGNFIKAEYFLEYENYISMWLALLQDK